MDAAHHAPAESLPPQQRLPIGFELKGSPALLDALERESVLFNLKASLRVYARSQFFEWTQGLLQNLVRHDLLLCARHATTATSLHADAFGTFPDEPGQFADAFRRDTTFVPQLIKSWKANRYEPICCTLGKNAAEGLFERQLERLGARSLSAHGTYGSSGELQSFFVFVSSEEHHDSHSAMLLSLIVPFLNAAWMRTQISREANDAGASTPKKEILTGRQKEILSWVYLGKSNIEIGMILDVSPLTVKNHVQKILRKLDVQNRTQAIARGVELRLVGR